MPPKTNKTAIAEKTDSSLIRNYEVSIEFCKSWGAFKTRAEKLQKSLHGKGIKVKLNEDKPRKGAFVVKILKPSDTVVLELLNLQRPFPKLKALDMDEVAGDVFKALDL